MGGAGTELELPEQYLNDYRRGPSAAETTHEKERPADGTLCGSHFVHVI